MLAVAVRGPLAAKTGALSESHTLSLAKLLGDMLLLYGRQVQGGYEPGTSLARWREQTGGEGE